MSSVEQAAADRLSRELARFTEALDALQPVAERRAKGQQFNAYNLSDDGDDKAICIGPITSSPVCLVEASGAAADLIEAALRLASDYAFSAMLAARPEVRKGELIRRDEAVAAINGAFAEHAAAIRKSNAKRGGVLTMAGHEFICRADRARQVAIDALTALRRPAPTVEEVARVIREEVGVDDIQRLEFVEEAAARIHALWTGEKG